MAWHEKGEKENHLIFTACTFTHQGFFSSTKNETKHLPKSLESSSSSKRAFQVELLLSYTLKWVMSQSRWPFERHGGGNQAAIADLRTQVPLLKMSSTQTPCKQESLLANQYRPSPLRLPCLQSPEIIEKHSVKKNDEKCLT